MKYELETYKRYGTNVLAILYNNQSIGSITCDPESNSDILDSFHEYIDRINFAHQQSEAKRERVDRDVRESRRDGEMLAEE